MLTQLYSDLGIPASYRMMQGNSVHAYKLINAKGEVQYAKFQWRPRQGEKYLTRAEAAKIQGADFNNLTSDLFGAIQRGDFPKWDLYAQLMKPEDLGKYRFDPLDSTKVWPDVPSRKIGTLTLNTVPEEFLRDYGDVGLFAGEPRCRALSRPKTACCKAGCSPTTTRRRTVSAPTSRSCRSTFRACRCGTTTATGMAISAARRVRSTTSRRGWPGAYSDNPHYRFARTPLAGTTQQAPITRTDNFTQAGEYYRKLSKTGQENLIGNLAADLGAVKHKEVKQIMLESLLQGRCRLWPAADQSGQRRSCRCATGAPRC